MSVQDPQQVRFNQLFGDIRDKLEQLKRRNLELEKENRKLQSELKKRERQAKDVFSSLGESERIALRHQIYGLIARIDKHLEESTGED